MDTPGVMMFSILYICICFVVNCVSGSCNYSLSDLKTLSSPEFQCKQAIGVSIAYSMVY